MSKLEEVWGFKISGWVEWKTVRRGRSDMWKGRMMKEWPRGYMILVCRRDEAGGTYESLDGWCVGSCN